MKKLLTLLTALCLALLLTGCGPGKIPEERLQALLGKEFLFTDRMAGIVSVTVNSHQSQDGVDTVKATVVSDNGFTVYTDDCTIYAVYNKETKNWELQSVTSVAVGVEPKQLPTAATVDELMNEEVYSMTGFAGGNPEAVLMPGYTVGEASLDVTNPVRPIAILPLDFEGQTYGWFTFHGGASLNLEYDPRYGTWSPCALMPGTEFDVDCVLEGRTYQSETFRDHVGGYTSYWQDYNWTVTFGEFDWRQGAMTGCELICYDQTENVDYIHKTDVTYELRNINKTNKFDLDNPHYDWVLYLGEDGFYEDSFVMQTTEDTTADTLLMWEYTNYATDYVLNCTRIS